MALRVSIGMVGLVLSVAPASAAVFQAELDFVTRASAANRLAVEESRLASERASDPGVKALARRLFEDHATAEAELQASADGSGAVVPTGLDRDDQAGLEALRGESGAAFDRAYVADQDKIHSNALTLYGDYMLLGENKKLKALAIRMIPITQKQLKSAQQLAGG